MTRISVKLNAESCLGGVIEAVKSNDGNEDKLMLTYIPLIAADTPDNADDSKVPSAEVH